MARTEDINASVRLPPGLDAHVFRRAVDFIEKGLVDLMEIYHEQANVFSAIVGIFGTKALDSLSSYEKHRHAHTAQQRFPDLCRRGCGKITPNDCLESKGSKRHAGWYVIWRYLVDPTESLEVGKPVIIWRVDVVFLEKGDWKYEQSKAGASGGGRTHTFGVKNAATKLKSCAVYQRKDVVIRDGKPIPRNGH